MSNSLPYTYHLSVGASAFCWFCQPAFIWLPIARTFPLVVAILHNLIYSGLTHPTIIQDLVLTGKKNTKKKERRYIKGNQKKAAK